MHSEILELFAAEAIKEGLFKRASEEDNKTEKKDGGRVNLKDIEMLYGKGNPDNKTVKELFEQAHPTPAIVAPAYDAVNGLVENLYERQNIMLDLIHRQPTGSNTQRRYVESKQALINELISTGMICQTKKLNDEMKLADHCTEELIKEAAIPVAVWIIGAVATALVGFGAFQNYGYIDQGVISNCTNALEKLTEVKPSLPALKKQLSELEKGINFIKSLGEKVSKTGPESMPKGLNRENVVQLSAEYAQSSQGKQALDLLSQYQNACQTLNKIIISTYVPLIETSDAQEESHSDIVALLEKEYHYLVPEDKTKFVMQLKTLAESLTKSASAISKRKSAAEAYVKENKDTLEEQLKGHLNDPIVEKPQDVKSQDKPEESKAHDLLWQI